MKNLVLTILLLTVFSTSGFSRLKDEVLWISYPSANVTDYGVYHFRKTFELEKVPESLVVYVSADNRYNLFVNGQRVCYGPAKGDLKSYKYDVIDVASFLTSGKNVIAALVYNGGQDKPLALISVQTAFMLQTEDSTFNWLNTGSEWKVFKNPAYRVISYKEMIFDNRWFNGFYACGGGDEVFGDKYPWGWEQVDFDDSNWKKAELLIFERTPWNLVERNIPFMDDHLEYPQQIPQVTGINFPTGTWNGRSIIIPPNTKASVLLDFDALTMGYPELTVRGGKNSSVKIKYAEALYEKVNLKAHRDSVNGKIMYGVWDVFHPDGQSDRTFRPLWKRAFRYIQLIIETTEESLEVTSFKIEYSGYPYPDVSTFTSSDTTLNKIFNMSVRTLRMCSGETYYDTPFYEQLNYGGDDRVISELSPYFTSDDRLLKEALRLYSQSENSETGLLKSAYPSRFDFDMGTWSLAWIQSLREYYFLREDSAFVSQFIPKIERILSFYERHLDEESGLIGTVKNQNFIDWSIRDGSIPRADKQRKIKQSALLSLYYAYSLDCATGLFKLIGFPEKAEYWENISKNIKEAVYKNCWDKEKRLFKDYADKEIYTQHTNLLAIICDVVTPGIQQELLNQILTYDGFDEVASSYFSFFIFKAMQKTGQEDLFLQHLGFWKDFINRGLTTCGETGFASHDRSDCHVWSAHPAYFLLSSVCGIKPGDIGFHTVYISPNLEKLTHVAASMSHPAGKISVNYEQEAGALSAIVELPKGLTGIWEYHGEKIQLEEGINKIKVNETKSN